jgi:hypothetical protein
MNASWMVDAGLFEKDTLPKLQEIGIKVGDMASAGDVDAQECMETYETLRRSFDPVTHHRLRLSVYKLRHRILSKETT